MEEVPGHHKLYVLGMVGRQYFGKRDVDMDKQFPLYCAEADLHRARLITEEIVEHFWKESWTKCTLRIRRCRKCDGNGQNMQLLPLKKAEFLKWVRMPAIYQEEIELSPSADSSGYYGSELPVQE